ncbi:MAG TPA: SIR2 family protein [Flavobacteriales bacterium]|nr:SIR2 family protein [Flavobacteriales bacterium]
MAKFDQPIESFIKKFVTDLEEGNVAIFAGAGMSVSAGFVNWSELLRDIANDLHLDVDREWDLISIAQYHFNEKRNRDAINRAILEEFSAKTESTENHRILAKLPIHTYWTTNYDILIEQALKEAFKIVDVKYDKDQLQLAKPRRNATVYKMHGDVEHPTKAIITKQDFETYHRTHEPFITALSSDLTFKTFLFIGFSFTDPNLDYVLSRLSIQFGDNGRQHYCFIRKCSRADYKTEDEYNYELRKQTLKVNDLKRYKIEALLIDKYSQITEILSEIEQRFKKRTIFISGSAEEYGTMDSHAAQNFIHQLTKQLVFNGNTIVNGFGLGVGSAVINGALDAVYEKPHKHSEEQLIMRPFPQFPTGDKDLKVLWREYRYKMIPYAGISIFIFGNKKDPKTGKIIIANGVRQEFEIATELGLIPIPVAATGYMAQQIYEIVMAEPGKYYKAYEHQVVPIIKELSDPNLQSEEIIKKIIDIIKILKT